MSDTRFDDVTAAKRRVLKGKEERKKWKKVLLLALLWQQKLKMVLSEQMAPFELFSQRMVYYLTAFGFLSALHCEAVSHVYAVH